jgi:hypothetical protein
MIKNITSLLSLVLSGLMILLLQQARAEGIKEDCIGFNPENIAVKNIQERWKLVEGMV